jgi:DNA-binding winged helix-turn-helix (wHTH) protein/TolB-like protein
VVRHTFGTFEFDSDSGELSKNGRVVALEPQPAKALALLLGKAGDVVSREQLRDAVWGADTHVDFDRGIAYCMSQIRAALNDSADNPRFIQTVPRQGFRFIAPVASASARGDAGELRRDLAGAASGREGGPVAPVAPVAPAKTFNNWVTIPLALAMLAASVGMMYQALSAPPIRERVVVAVSVFDNETGQAEFDRPVAGLSDLVVEHLTKIDPDRIAVIGNAAVLRQPRNIRNLKAVARSIRADYVLLGQLQRGETGLRFITHFIRLRDEAHLKANRLTVADEKLGGLEAAVVEEFARAVRDHVLTPPSN